eukprot:m51a1_g2664 hypothetical protein (1336) ;mRNA; f:686926-702098
MTVTRYGLIVLAIAHAAHSACPAGWLRDPNKLANARFCVADPVKCTVSVANMPLPGNIIMAYTFSERTGSVVSDHSGSSTSMDLKMPSQPEMRPMWAAGPGNGLVFSVAVTSSGVFIDQFGITVKGCIDVLTAPGNTHLSVNVDSTDSDAITKIQNDGMLEKLFKVVPKSFVWIKKEATDSKPVSFASSPGNYPNTCTVSKADVPYPGNLVVAYTFSERSGTTARDSSSRGSQDRARDLEMFTLRSSQPSWPKGPGNGLVFSSDEQVVMSQEFGFITDLSHQNGGCGNNVVEQGEDCDSGPGIIDGMSGEMCDSGPMCLPDCRCPTGYVAGPNMGCSLCGNKAVDVGEECDSGPKCLANCSCPSGFLTDMRGGCWRCGNGEVEDGEECDTGPNCGQHTCKCSNASFVPDNSTHNGGCTQCGNGVVDPGETCDSGPHCPAGCVCPRWWNPEVVGSLHGCTLCQNGRVDPGEECDQGPHCLPTCRCEALFVAENGTAGCSNCGDGIVSKEYGEQCDGTPFCTEFCRCWSTAVLRGGVCSVCGNGLLNENEECDGGLQCTSDCRCEKGFVHSDANRGTGCQLEATSSGGFVDQFTVTIVGCLDVETARELVRNISAFAKQTSGRDVPLKIVEQHCDAAGNTHLLVDVDSADSDVIVKINDGGDLERIFKVVKDSFEFTKKATTDSTRSIAPVEEITEAFSKRFAAKSFTAQPIPAALWTALEDSLVLSPSSFGQQPYAFFVVDNPAARQRMRAGYGQPQFTEAPKLVVIASRTDLSAADGEKLIKRTAQDMVMGNLTYKDAATLVSWAQAQSYIPLGFVLAGAAALGVDACPMEGFNSAEFDAILGIKAKGLTSRVAVAFGYADPDHWYSKASKPVHVTVSIGKYDSQYNNFWQKTYVDGACKASLTLATGCGNNVVEQGEDCDSGPGIIDGMSGEMCDSGPMCLPDCRCPTGYVAGPNMGCSLCGNKAVDVGEECDSGPKCLANCSCPSGFLTDMRGGCWRCGNGEVEDGEECDTGPNCGQHTCKCSNASFVPDNSTHNGGCTQCGNGVVDPGETCDSGPHCPAGCVCPRWWNPEVVGSLHGCTLCQNGRVDPGEECDQGPHCLPTCRCEALFVAENGTAGCSNCGDGIVSKEYGEQCDGTPFCTEFCRCWSTAVLRGGVCSVCGNGLLNENEECDGGLQCTSDCRCEKGFVHSDANRGTGCQLEATSSGGFVDQFTVTIVGCLDVETARELVRNISAFAKQTSGRDVPLKIVEQHCDAAGNTHLLVDVDSADSDVIVKINDGGDLERIFKVVKDSFEFTKKATTDSTRSIAPVSLAAALECCAALVTLTTLVSCIA